MIGFKSFGKKSTLDFNTSITAIVGPNGSGKSNTAEAFRFVLGEQSMKSLRGKRGEDLIWGGSTEVSRSNRASVKATFDNSKRLLDIDFDEVVIERVVYRDGTNEYIINGSKVRLKDVTALLAGANIGFSGHHIISQGEADRIISASSKERRQMIEDALGLRVYQNKKDESILKLERTQENKNQVEALRKENVPHLRFLEKQVKKIEKARMLREELVGAFHEYLKREEEYLRYEKETILKLREEPTNKLKDTERRIREIREILEKTKKGDKQSEEILALEKRLSLFRAEKSEHIRVVGRIEGQIAYEERRIEEEKKKTQEEEGRPIPYKDVRNFWEELELFVEGVNIEDNLELHDYKKIVHNIKRSLQHFIDTHLVKSKDYVPDKKSLEDLATEVQKVEEKIESVSKQIEEVGQKIKILSEDIEKEKDESREIEREMFALMSLQTELKSTLSNLDARHMALHRDEEEFNREIREGIALIGRQIQGYKDYEYSENKMGVEKTENREVQVERRRVLEKMKIRLEEMGGSSTDEIQKEYNEVKERDDFLAKELTDLELSSELLRKLIDDLDQELSEKFTQGLEAISAQFNDFFALMFGGGSASLTVVNKKTNIKKVISEIFSDSSDAKDENEETKVGVDIEVSLPKKRIQSLMMLSGGERALTSIALIFAMSQVNPPPFLILDETDAALDEANSKRYGDMILNLSEKSQLIVITHNRETMSRANILYGITMSADGVSRILSVKFDDAVVVAK